MSQAWAVSQEGSNRVCGGKAQVSTSSGEHRTHGGAIRRGDTMCLEVMGHDGSFRGTCDTVGVRKEGLSITFPVVPPGSQL